MYLISIRQIRTITIEILLIYSSVDSLSIGRVNNTRFTSIDHINKDSIWLSVFTTWSQCVCEVLSSNFSSMAIALNMYRNGSCQLFVTLPFTYTLEINNDSTLILLKQLPSKDLAPCCSDLSWLINKINNSQQMSANVTKPSFLIIDDNNFLVTLTYQGPLVQFNRSTLNVIQSKPIVTSATSLSYRNGRYYIPGCNGTCNVHVFSTQNLSLITRIPLSTSSTYREITFVRNGSLMLVASYTRNEILFFDVISTNNYTSSIPPSISVTGPCGLHAVNDSFIYIASWTSSTPVSTLIFSNNTWILSSLPNTKPSGNQTIFQTKVDSCGRLWLGITYYGIRIFDPWGVSLLYEWPVATSVDGFLLLDNYELFVTDFKSGRILHFNPNIEQCTS